MSNIIPICRTPRPQNLTEGINQRSFARTDPAPFIRHCLGDSRGEPVELAEVHCQLQDFLSEHPMALVELPRDHGKSFQVCGRILWELGRNPALRVKVICATETVAEERSR